MTHPWAEDPDAGRRGGLEYDALVRAEREMLDAVSTAAFSPEATREVTARLEELRDLAQRHRVEEPHRVGGWRPDLPGRGNALFPPYLVDHEEPGLLRGRVTFTPFFLGGNAAAHGGTQPLLFDDVLGRVMNQGLSGVARTASLKVDFRRITPIDVELGFEATCDRVDGRKRWGSGRLLGPDGTVLADAEALFLVLLPGQQ